MAEFFGEILRDARESKNLSIDDASERTRIPAKVISALEDGRLDDLPSAFYAKTFVKTYAKFLEVIEEEQIKDYLKGVKKKDRQVLMLKGEESPGFSFVKYRKYVGIVVVALVIAWLVAFSIGQMKKFVKNYAAAKKEKAEAVKKSEPKKPVTPTRQEEKAEEDKVKVQRPVKKIDGVELMIEARYNTWVQVRCDGRLLFRGILKKKEKDTWKAKDKIELEVGNAGGVSAKINEEEVGSLGKKGEKKSIVITEDGIKQQ